MRKDDFIGQAFYWFTGVVEDVTDPEMLNRVRVRCIGYHTESTARVKTVDLPWATVVMPNTDASLKGVGGNHELEIGSWVVGFFRDGMSAQDPMVLGSIATQTEGEKDIPVEAQLSPPTNKVHKTQAGHLIEFDNTADIERINIQHGTNKSTLNIDAEGVTIVKSISLGDEPKTHTLTMDPKTNIVNLLHHTGTTINIAEDGTINIISATEGEGDDASGNTINMTGNTTITGTLTVTEDTSLKKKLAVTDTITGSSTVAGTNLDTGHKKGTAYPHG